MTPLEVGLILALAVQSWRVLKAQDRALQLRALLGLSHTNGSIIMQAMAMSEIENKSVTINLDVPDRKRLYQIHALVAEELE